MTNSHQTPLPRLDATHSGYSRGRRPRSRRRTCTRLGCIAVITVLVFAVLAVIALRVFLRQKSTPEQWALVQSVEKDVIQLSPDWHRPAAAPSPELFEAQKRLSEQIMQVRDKYEDLLWGDYSKEQDLMRILRRGEAIPADKQSSFAMFLQDVEPLIRETSSTVNRPDYTMELGMFSADTSRLLSVQVLAKLTSIVALARAQQGDCVGAMELCLLPIRYTRRPEQSYVITHLIAVAVASISSHSTYALSEQCSDTVALKHGLDAMNELRAAAFPGEIGNWKYGDSIGALSHAASTGYQVDLTPQPLAGYYRQAGKVYDGTFHKWVVEHLPESDPRVAVAKSHLEAQAKQGQYADARQAEIELETLGSNRLEGLKLAAAKLALGVDPYALFYTKAMVNTMEMESRTSVSLAWYDLTRTHLALRLAQADSASGQAPGDAARLGELTAYLTPVPSDPFTSAPFLFSEKQQVYYSFGPDKKDDGAAVLYDATNGSLSSGDVWLTVR